VSPKNKGKFGKGAPAVPEVQDEFVSGVNRTLMWLKPHAFRLALAAGGVVIVLLAWTTWSWWTERKETKATALLAEAVELSRRPVMPPPPPPPEPKEGEEPPPAPPPPDPQSFPSTKARADAALVPLQKLRDDFGDIGVAKRARLLHAGLLLDAERYDDAIALYRATAEDGPGDLRVLAREGIGYAIEARALASADAAARDAGLKEALAAFAAVQDDPKGPHRGYALYHQGRIKAKLGDKDAAIALFKEVLGADVDSALRKDVKNRLAMLGAPPEE
jgi:hypothetical protein